MLKDYATNTLNMNKFKLITWNVRSIRSLNSFQKFKNELAGFVGSTNVDIIMLNETWTSELCKFNMYKLPKYQSFSCNRKESIGGGILIYVHERHIAKIVSKKCNQHIEYISLNIKLCNLQIMINAVYRPPRTSIDLFLDELENLLEVENPLIVGGDFNINGLRNDSTSQRLSDVLNSSGAIVTNEAITRNASKTKIDYLIIKNFPQKISVNTYTSDGLVSSDHNLLLTIMDLRVPKSNKKSIFRKKYDYVCLKDSFDCNLDEMSELTANECCNHILNSIRNAIDKSTSIQQIKIRNDVWSPPWAEDVYYKLQNRSRNLINKINKLERSYKPTSKLKKKLEDLNAMINDHSNKISKRFYEQLINSGNKNSWDVINSILGRNKKHDDINLLINDEVIYNTNQIANLFNEKFLSSSRNATLPTDSNNFIPKTSPTVNSFHFDVVTSEEINEILRNLQTSKATGSDGISCKIIKELSNNLIDQLTYLVNKIVIEASYPDALKFAHVVPIHKKGDKTDINNYRPIALLPIINKIVEKIILNRLQDFMITNKINDCEQYGYKKSIGTNEAVLKFAHDVSIALDKNEYVIVVFMDLTAAFDTLDRHVLLKKLSHLGIRGHVLSLIESYFINRQQSVKVGGTTSVKVVIEIGVAQGSILGPYFFTISQFDAPNMNSKRIKFADDYVVYRPCKREELDLVMKEIMEDVEVMNEYFRSCGLKMNFQKTNFMIIRNNDLVDLPSEVSLGHIKISRVTSHKFLGVQIDDKFNFKEHVSLLVDKLTQACRALSIIRHHLPQQLLLQFYHAHFMSHLHYCCFVLAKISKDEIMRIQRLQNRCIKLIFNLDARHSTVDLFKSYDHKTLPVIGILYTSLIMGVKKSLLLDMDELIKFEVSRNNRRSSGDVIPSRFLRKRNIGTDISYLGPVLYNQLSKELKGIKNLTKFKVSLKRYLLDQIDLLLAPDQLQTHKIA
jgi:exonuclease III